ncbi:MutS-related protein [Plebeiibacterium sediminum]|uniref:DNA mismatch repair proteins mutS family domain-containing protein n=1 Tax=Plebeiibacterium sediminum TaxID=2992112 RepID=A0AAE3M6Q7_9BACT|nr:hypothetical protein [Plebeiobacterium sediminum]MCW3788123.1 hypothetical protein [Plebeiobacterium sediminum]
MPVKDAILFSNFEWFYNLYKPHSPYGLEAKERASFIVDYDELEKQYTTTDLFIDFIKTNIDYAIKVEYHLSKTDRLNTLDKEDFDAADLLLIKKLLIHYKAIAQTLPSNIKEFIDIDFKSSSLLIALSPNNDKSETFYLSSSFSDDLLKTRSKIVEQDRIISELKKTIYQNIKSNLNLDFTDHDFLLVNNSKTQLFKSSLIQTEFYDSLMMMVKPAFPSDYINALLTKEDLLNEEAEEEKQVLLQLSGLIHHEEQQINQYINHIEWIDTNMAKARLAVLFNLNKPHLGKDQTINVSLGRWLSLEDEHSKAGLKYTPLTADFDRNTILLSGSNMGGKTVLLKTLTFLQLLAQYGFYVPAINFKTQVFKSIHILSNSSKSETKGLSSFGEEIYLLNKILSCKDVPGLFIVDELAQTTNATEAKAILYAVLKHLSESTQLTSFCSTHFIDVPNINGVSKYKMKGLNDNNFKKFYTHTTKTNINEKIKVMNAFMQYEVEKDNGSPPSFDALTIAKLLGLDENILKEANQYLNNKGTE